MVNQFLDINNIRDSYHYELIQESKKKETKEHKHDEHTHNHNSPFYKEEITFQKDDYEKPYNLFEELVEKELDLTMARYIDVCRCSQCRSDIIAVALQKLPAKYITGKRNEVRTIGSRYLEMVMKTVKQAIDKVYKNPRSTCNKIKQVLWAQPQLNWV